MVNLINPLVSIVLPVYNGDVYLQSAIESILNQTFIDFELVIINDASTDNTDQIINNFKDKRIRYFINETNLKIIETLNKGINLSRGKYIARMDADDISFPNRIEDQVNFLEKNVEIDVLGTGFEIIGNNQNDRFSNNTVVYNTDSKKIAFNLIYNNVILHPSVMFRSSVFHKYKIYYNKKFIHAEEYYLWTQLIIHTKFANLPDILLKYRVHDNQISLQNHKVQLDNSYSIQQLYLKNLGLNITFNQAKLFVDFLQKKKINDNAIFELLNIIDLFEKKIKLMEIMDVKYSLMEINKNLKNVIINSNNNKLSFLKSFRIIYILFQCSLKQKISFFLKIKF